MIHKRRPSNTTRNNDQSLQRIIKSMFQIRNGGRPDATHIIVVIGNGDSEDFSSVIKTAANSMQEDAVVYIVNFGGDVDNTALLEAATSPEFYLILNVTDTADAKITKSNMIKEITEACSRYYMDVTIAYDSIPLSPQQEENRRQQLEGIKEILHDSECHTRVRVIFGSGLDSPVPGVSSSENIIQEHRRPRMNTILRKWRNWMLNRQKWMSERGPSHLTSPDVDVGKRLILVLSSRHESEFKSIVSELRRSMSLGTDVLVVLDETVKPNFVLTWQQLLDYSKVIVLKEPTQDISRDVLRFICYM